MPQDWIWTDHAKQRATERLVGQSLTDLLQDARRPGRRQLERIRRTCPGAAQVYMRGFNGRYFLVSRGRYVFVIEPPHTIITAWDWQAEQTLELCELQQLERRRCKNGTINLNEKEFYGLVNLARKDLKGGL